MGTWDKGGSTFMMRGVTTCVHAGGNDPLEGETDHAREKVTAGRNILV